MKDYSEDFWDIVKSYKSWSVSKKEDGTKYLTLVGKRGVKINFVFDPNYITEDTIKKLQRKIIIANEYWGAE
jgi:hypothetical protein